MFGIVGNALLDRLASLNFPERPTLSGLYQRAILKEKDRSDGAERKFLSKRGNTLKSTVFLHGNQNSKQKRKVFKWLRESKTKKSCRKSRPDLSGHSGSLIHFAVRLFVEIHDDGPQRALSRLLFYFADFLCEPLEKPGIRTTASSFQNRGIKDEPQVLLEQSVFKKDYRRFEMLLSYKERHDIVLAPEVLRQTQRFLHHEIPIQPFDATILLPINVDCSQNQISLAPFLFEGDSSKNSSGEQFAYTPHSIPRDRAARRRYSSRIYEYTENILYQVRDTLIGEQNNNMLTRKAVFNEKDRSHWIYLFRGGHCAKLDFSMLACSQDDRDRNSKMMHDHLRSIPHSVRSLIPLSSSDKFVTYFQFRPRQKSTFRQSQFYHRNRTNRMAVQKEQKRGPKLEICVGLSPKSMPLVGETLGQSSGIGFNSSGSVWVSGRQFRTIGFSYGSVIGACVKVQSLFIDVLFFVNGGVDVSANASVANEDISFSVHRFSRKKAATRNCEQQSCCKPCCKPNQCEKDFIDVEVYFPTVSIESEGCEIFADYSAADILNANPGKRVWSKALAFAENMPIRALDGTRVF